MSYHRKSDAVYCTQYRLMTLHCGKDTKNRVDNV